MLRVTVPAMELYDPTTEEFILAPERTLSMEHSLVSVSKWEAKWKKPFLGRQEKTQEETLDYLRCMTITQNVDPEVYNRIPPDTFKEILDYIDDPMTATTFAAEQNRPSREIITSEIIYYWMIALNIDIKFETWHLNRLLALIKVCSIKNQPKKKMGKKALAKRNAKLNAARRSAMHSTG